MDLDGIAFHVLFPAVHQPGQRITGEDAPRVAHELLQQRQLATRQGNGLLLVVHGEGLRVQADPPAGEQAVGLALAAA